MISFKVIYGVFIVAFIILAFVAAGIKHSYNTASVVPCYTYGLMGASVVGFTLSVLGMYSVVI